MKTYILHTDPLHYPVAATMALEIQSALPPGAAELACTTNAKVDDADLVIAVFSLKQGSFAPTVPCYRELADAKVAYVAILGGETDAQRARKTAWGIKKQFCGNQVVAGYLCPAPDDVIWGPAETEIEKVKAFARNVLHEHGQDAHQPLAVNF